MSTHDAELGEFFLHIFTDYSSLDAGHHVIFINPLNFIHSSAIDRNDGSLFSLLTHQAFSYICPSELQKSFTLQKESERRCVPSPWQ